MKLEYNVTGVERKALVGAISELLNVPIRYLGAPSFAYTVGDYTVGQNGTLSYADEIKHSELNELTTKLKERGFEAEGQEIGETTNSATETIRVTESIETTEVTEAIDSSTVSPTPRSSADSDGSTGIDTNTKASADTDADTSTNASSDDACQMTVEISKEGFSDGALVNLKKIIASKETLLKKALSVDNLPVRVTEDRLYFPWFTLGEVAGEANTYIRLVYAICDMAKKQKRITATDKPVDNEKFAFRIFLIRLGFIGTEYREARKLLLSKLSGNSAFRSGESPKKAAVDKSRSSERMASDTEEVPEASSWKDTAMENET